MLYLDVFSVNVISELISVDKSIVTHFKGQVGQTGDNEIVWLSVEGDVSVRDVSRHAAVNTEGGLDQYAFVYNVIVSLY